MSSTEIQQLAREISGFVAPHWYDYLVAFAVVAAGAYFGAYLAEKGKNTATKEDVTHITKQIEAIRSEYSQKLETLKGGYQLRSAVLEKTFAAHQDGYALWRKLLFSVHSENIHAVAGECERWWTSNCLYLSPNARASFKRAIFAANDHGGLLKARLEPETIKENFQLILKAGDDLVAGADLPLLPDEIAPLDSGKTPGPQP